MDEQQTTPPNPFTPPATDDAPSAQATPKPIHPLLILVLLLASLFVGGCAFFCSCLGVFMLGAGTGPGPWIQWVFWFCGAVALAATVGTFVGVKKLIRRSQRKSAHFSAAPTPQEAASDRSDEV